MYVLISSCHDYYNALFTCLNSQAMEHLQIVQNSVAAWPHCSGFVGPLESNFQVLFITYKALHDIALEYITELLTLKNMKPLKSATSVLGQVKNKG